MSGDTWNDYDRLLACADDDGRLATGWQDVVRATCDPALAASLTCGTWEPVSGRTYGSAFRRLARIPDGLRSIPAAVQHRVDLSGCAVGGLAEVWDRDLSGIVACGADLDNVYLCGSDLTGGLLQRASFKDGYVGGCRFAAADLYGANFSWVEGVNSDFVGARLGGADCRGANLAGSRFDGADLRGTNFEDAYLDGATFHGALRFEVEGGDAPIDGWAVVGGRMVADR